MKNSRIQYRWGFRCAIRILLLGFFLSSCTYKERIHFNTCPEGMKRVQISGKIYKPKGDGPFPAVIILHGCGGLSEHHSDWANRFVKWGYVALTIDSFSSRGSYNVCGNPHIVGPLERILDVYCAAKYLQPLPYVDEDRIGIIGFSHGGWTVLRAVQEYAKNLAEVDMFPFSAAVAFYPYCGDVTFLNVSIPTLILIGDKDDWTPAQLCKNLKWPNIDSKILEVIVFEGVYHSFDRQAPPRTYLGHQLVYNYPASKKAKKRTKEFFDNYLKREH